MILLQDGLKNIVNGKIAKLRLQSIGIETDFMLDLLIKDDAQSDMMRRNFGKEKLTAEILQNSIAKATLYATVPPALQKAPVVAKIYSDGLQICIS